ncbi:MAG: hypothetical protein J3R72DRAFT_490322 [Linnemannia gamsii]|nr:MAG: hypothetical protein J3R72DRAFT_490322 [Linnemannia gamsii]
MPSAVVITEYSNSDLEKPFLSPAKAQMVEPNINDNSSSSSTSTLVPVTLPPWIDFITKLVQNLKAPARCLLSSLAYIQRLFETLTAAEPGLNCNYHLVFFACLILASNNNSRGSRSNNNSRNSDSSNRNNKLSKSSNSNNSRPRLPFNTPSAKEPKAYSRRKLNKLPLCLPTLQMIEYITHCASTLIKAIQPPSAASADAHARASAVPPSNEIVSILIRITPVPASTLLAVLVIVKRIKHTLLAAGKSMRGSPHQIVMTCVIVEPKYLIDSTPWN